MGILRNRNYPACKSLRKFEANPADSRRFSGILSDVDYFQEVSSHLFQRGGSIVSPAASHIPSTYFLRAKLKDPGRAPAKTETTRSPGCRQPARRRSGPFFSKPPLT